MKIRPINKTTISDEIVEQIMGAIERGDLLPGQRLPSERELCVRFGTGRSSLREALRCLSIVGVLHARVGEGTSVAVDGGRFLGKILRWRLITEQQDIRNLMEVRIALEGVSAASVAVNGSESDFKLFDSMLEKMGAAQADQRRFSALDLEFHLALAKASGNSLVADLITLIRGQLAKGLSRVLSPPNALSMSLKEHTRIVRKVRSRDADGARDAMEVHLRAAAERYHRLLATESATTVAKEEGSAPALEGAGAAPVKRTRSPRRQAAST